MMLNGRRFHSLCFLVVFAGASLLARRAHANGSVNFDDQPKDKIIQNQYVPVGGDGLRFAVDGSARIYQGLVTPHTMSSPNVLISGNLNTEFDGRALTGTFATGQQTVSMWAGYYKFIAQPATLMGTLTIYGPNHSFIKSTSLPVTGNQSTTQFTLTDTTGANIKEFTLDLGVRVYVTIDDLQWSGGTPPPPPPGPPVVHITNPQNQGFVDATNGSLQIDGFVDGQNVVPELTVELTLLTPPPPPHNNSLPTGVYQQTNLTLNGPSFGGQLFPNLLIGIYQLTVRAWNTVGEGSATVTFTNLPPSLRQIPGLQFAVPTGNCQIARFADGARGYFPASGTDYFIKENIIVKWLAVKNYPILRNDGTLGCPVEFTYPIVKPNEYPFIVLGDVQDFERGRIYAMIGATAHYTPRVFSNAIDIMATYTTTPLINSDGEIDTRTFNDFRGVNEVGVPITDPVTYIFGPDPTWLFQRFRRPGFTGVANTLEVRGPNPNPKLYIERIGGGLVDYKAGTRMEPTDRIAPPPTDVGITAGTPAVWDVFQCVWNTSAQTWTCPASRPHLKSVSAGRCPGGPDGCATAVPLYTTESQVKDDMEFCVHDTPKCVFLESCPQWSAIPTAVDGLGVEHKPFTDPLGQNFMLGQLVEEDTPSDHVDVQSMGWVQSSNNAGEDLTYDHEHMQGRKVPIIGIDLPDFLGTVCHDLIELGGCSTLPVNECGAGSSIGDILCKGWADRVFHMRPLAQSIPDPNADHLRLPNVPAGPPFWNLLANQASPANDLYVFNSNPFQNQGSSGDIEVEWEAVWGNNFLGAGHVPQPEGTKNTIWSATLQPPPPVVPQLFEWPRVGALAFVNGRWMLDCGHVVDTTNHHFHAEIHPINTLITSVLEDAPAAMNMKNRVTKALVWINQFYEGKPFHTKVWAPPRPSPKAEMNTLYVPYHAPGGGGGQVLNLDGSTSFFFSNYKAGNPPMATLEHSKVTVATAVDGISVSVEGPPGSHGIEAESGQPFYPGDYPAKASGTVGEFIARWYVGWSNCGVLDTPAGPADVCLPEQ